MSFALGNRLLGILDEKQHRERQDESKQVGWYHKTDFAIKAVINGEEFNYDGRFDIGDGGGDLIAHIKNFYEYSLSPNCPFIPEWKKQGGDYYREKMESLRWGRDVFLPFLTQHSELTPEDEKLLAEIMATETDWNRKAEEPTQEELLEQAKALIDAFCREEYEQENGADYTDLSKVGIAYTTTEDEQREIQAAVNLVDFRMETYIDGTLTEYTQYDSLSELIQNGLSYLDFDSLVSVTEEQLAPFYEEKTPHYTVEQTSDAFANPTAAQDNTDLIGREITIDNRRYLIESVGEISGDVSLRDITFQTNVGFPINRVEKIGYIRRLLEQAQPGLPPEERTEATAEPITETVAEYPAVENGLPYDIVIQTIRSGEPEQKQEKEILAHAGERKNYRITDDALGVGGAKEKFKRNMAAIHLLHDLQIENRLATPEEQETLSRYVGWGGLSMAFDEHNAAWANEYRELKAALSEEEYRAAMESTLTAFYTPPVVIKAMYEALDRLGFSQGNMLEPSCGTGNFLGLLPDGMERSKLHGIEIDPLSGRIAKQLYQKASIAIEGFEDTKLPDDHFDVVLGNVPFGEFKVNDSRYNSDRKSVV